MQDETPRSNTMQQGHVVEVFLHPADSSRILTVTDSPYCKPGVKREAGVRRCSVIRALVEITRKLYRDYSCACRDYSYAFHDCSYALSRLLALRHFGLPFSPQPQPPALAAALPTLVRTSALGTL
jgi:hypothetical protein